jgi:hypothetical protein
MDTTLLGRYIWYTGGSPTPGRDPWPAAVARIAAIIPGGLGSMDVSSAGGLTAQGLTALALGVYILAAESGQPPEAITLEQVLGELHDQGTARSGVNRWVVNEPYAVPAWTRRLAALGHDPDAGIRSPHPCPGRDSYPGYTLTYYGDVYDAYGNAGDPELKLPDPVDAAWVLLRENCGPGDESLLAEGDSSMRVGSALFNSVGPALAQLAYFGADVPWHPEPRL